MGFSVFEDLQRKFPDRFLNAGATEQSSVGVAAGLALEGFKVFFYAQAPFATMRCFEQIRLDICYNNLDVKIIGVAAGYYSNQLGVSHFATEDIALMRILPNMTVIVPGDPLEASYATDALYNKKGPGYLRLTKSGSARVHNSKKKINIKKAIPVTSGQDLLILASGSLLPQAVEVSAKLHAKNIKAGVVSYPTVKPLDVSFLTRKSKETALFVTMEEHFLAGGFGSAVSEEVTDKNLPVRLLRLGVNDAFTGITGEHDYLLEKNNLSSEKMFKSILEYISFNKLKFNKLKEKR